MPEHDHLRHLWHEEEVLERLSRKHKEALAIIFNERAEVWAALGLHGIEQKEIAERAGVDPSDVSRALSERGL